MIRLGVSTACFYPQPLETILPTLSALGVRMVECFVNTESEFSSSFANLLADTARQNKMEIVSVHPYSSLMEGLLLFSDYARRTQDGLAQYDRYFAFAASLGARYLTFHGERNMGPPDTEERWARRIEVYHRLCACAAQHGIALAQENVAWCKSAEPAFLRRLYQAVPELRYTLDIKQANRAGQDWREILDTVGDRLVNVHINDYAAKESCLLPGVGEMDYADFFARLQAVGYDNQVLIEVYRANFGEAAEMEAALHHLSRWAAI